MPENSQNWDSLENFWAAMPPEIIFIVGVILIASIIVPVIMCYVCYLIYKIHMNTKLLIEDNIIHDFEEYRMPLFNNNYVKNNNINYSDLDTMTTGYIKSQILGARMYLRDQRNKHMVWIKWIPIWFVVITALTEIISTNVFDNDLIHWEPYVTLAIAILISLVSYIKYRLIYNKQIKELIDDGILNKGDDLMIKFNT